MALRSLLCQGTSGIGTGGDGAAGWDEGTDESGWKRLAVWNLPWLLGLSTEAWGSESRGGDMEEEDGKKGRRG